MGVGTFSDVFFAGTLSFGVGDRTGDGGLKVRTEGSGVGRDEGVEVVAVVEGDELSAGEGRVGLLGAQGAVAVGRVVATLAHDAI